MSQTLLLSAYIYQAPTFLTIQVSRAVLNEAIGKLNAYASPRMASPSELLLTVDEITAIIDQGPLSRTLLLSAAHLKRVEVNLSIAESNLRHLHDIVTAMCCRLPCRKDCYPCC